MRSPCTTPQGRFFFHMMASLAQMERELIAERTKAGLEAARKRGRMVGRKRRMTPSKIESAKQLLGNGMPPRGICLRRDNWVSVRYAEELNSTTSSVTLQRADRHGILGEKPPDFQVSL
jgi:DNA invertase Pin-like site-specific DNA recombinase